MTLHVTNGDSTVMGLAMVGIDALPWRDSLHEGPVGKREWRAEFLGVPIAEFEARDRTLDTHDGDYVLWFEADLYDQLQLAEILARLRPGARVTLRQGFRDFGAMTGEQLQAVPAIALTDAALALGRQAWDALTATEPQRLLTIPVSDELPFLADAFVRLAQEYPWRRDGLALSERRLLASAPGTKYELFVRAARLETRPFMGDTWAFARLDRMAPLLRSEGDVLHRNERGERVLEGEETFVTDRWIGGVHVTPDTPWRWDDARETLVQRR